VIVMVTVLVPPPPPVLGEVGVLPPPPPQLAAKRRAAKAAAVVRGFRIDFPPETPDASWKSKRNAGRTAQKSPQSCGLRESVLSASESVYEYPEDRRNQRSEPCVLMPGSSVSSTPDSSALS
jgi:hypothetical protein